MTDFSKMAPLNGQRPYECIASHTPQFEGAYPRSGLLLPLPIDTEALDSSPFARTGRARAGSHDRCYEPIHRGSKSSDHSDLSAGLSTGSRSRRMSDPMVKILGPIDACDSLPVGFQKMRLENFAARRARLKSSPAPDLAVPLAELPDLIDMTTPSSSPINSHPLAVWSSFEDEPMSAGIPAPRSVCHRATTTSAKLDEETEDSMIEDVPMYLEDMNASADDLNRTQEALKEQEQRLEELVTVWAVEKVFLLHEVGRNQVERARPHYERKRMLKEVRMKADLTANAFLEASRAVEDRQKDVEQSNNVVEIRWLQNRLEHAKSDLQEQQKNHAAQLLEYQRLQREYDEKWSASWAMFEDAAPYFEAEDAFTAKVDATTEEVRKCQDAVAEAKDRYRNALKSLEDISRAVHAHRGNAELERPMSRTQTPTSRSATPVNSSSDHTPGKNSNPNAKNIPDLLHPGVVSATEALDLILAADDDPDEMSQNDQHGDCGEPP